MPRPESGLGGRGLGGGRRGALGSRLEGGREHDREEDEAKAHRVVPAQALLQDQPGEPDKHDQGDGLLDDLELITREFPGHVAEAVGGHLQAILEERQSPGDQDRYRNRLALQELEFQVAVPGQGHEDIGTEQEEDGFHPGH